MITHIHIHTSDAGVVGMKRGIHKAVPTAQGLLAQHATPVSGKEHSHVTTAAGSTAIRAGLQSAGYTAGRAPSRNGGVHNYAHPTTNHQVNIEAHVPNPRVWAK
jgi:hypothetical protein